MAKKKNRGKKSSGAKAGNSAVPENAQTSTELKVDSESGPSSAVPADGACDQNGTPKVICTHSITKEPTVCQKLYEKKVHKRNHFKSDFIDPIVLMCVKYRFQC